MSVKLTQQVMGKQPGDTYSGEHEKFLLENGYATKGDVEEVVARDPEPQTETKPKVEKPVNQEPEAAEAKPRRATAKK